MKDGIFLYLCSRNKNLLVKIEFFIVLDLIARKRPQGSRWRTLFLCLTTLRFFPPTLSAGVRFQAAKVAASRKLCKHRSPYSFTKKTAAFPFSFPFCPSPMGKGEKKKGIPCFSLVIACLAYRRSTFYGGMKANPLRKSRKAKNKRENNTIIN